jgi:hypothetical protein
MLLAIECLEGLYPGSSLPDEVFAGLAVSAAMRDELAWPAFVLWNARLTRHARKSLQQKRLLQEAEGMLAAWSLTETFVKPLLDETRHLLAER